ncbi:11S globulin seed storage protein 1-like [Euphorbia lathyris]|uniref:11S globulin seed storage protein 1-like n=1 Tax=Euphorbia lathyris TaxID=212925 RepID=UPI003314254D
MAYVSYLCCLILLLHSCIAISSKTNCQVITRLFAREPDIYTTRESGFVEIWDPNTDLFQCAGVQVIRFIIKPNAYILPIYANADDFSYVVQGNGIFGLIIPECSQELDGKKNECDNMFHLQSGDVLFFRTGETLWGYNSGNETLIFIAITRIPNNDLNRDVMRLPHWENTHSIMYVVKGEGHIQVVDDNGKNVFDGSLKEGQLLIVPHSFLMAEQAKSERLEYVTFKTNGNSITSDLSGQKSVINCLPLEVLISAFRINKEEAKNVKFGRKETSLVKIIP